MHQKTTFISLVLFICSSLPLFAQSGSTYYLKPKKHAIYLNGLAAGNSSTYAGIGVAGLNYEQNLYITRKEKFRVNGVFGITPPLGGDNSFFTYHIGPKLFLGDHTTWFTIDMQYFAIIGRLPDPDEPYRSTPTKVRYFNAGYLGLGYCYMGPRGFFFNPQLVMAGDEYAEDILLGLNLGIGYCF